MILTREVNAMTENLERQAGAREWPSGWTERGTFSRRRFVTTAVLAAGVAALSPSRALSRARLSPYYESEAWKETICSFSDRVCGPEDAASARRTVQACRVVTAPAASNFHEGFAAPVILVGGRFTPADAGCTQFFELDGRPFYDRSNPCERIKDLNAFEIRRLIYAAEVNTFGCVMNPCSVRRQPDAKVLAVFDRTARGRYNTDPRGLNVDYYRYFNNGRRPFYGFGVTSRNEYGGNGRAKSDLLLSSEDV